MSIVELVARLKEQQRDGVFQRMSSDRVWADYLEPVLRALGWDDLAPIGLHTVAARAQLGPKVRLIPFRGGLPVDETARKLALHFAAIDSQRHMAVVTNFDYWEVIRGYDPVAQWSAAQLVTEDGMAPSEQWARMVALLSREAVESGRYLAELDRLEKGREDLIDPLLRAFERLREEIGQFLIQNPELPDVKRGRDKRALDLLGITGDPARRAREEERLNAVVQRLIDRFLIFRFAEDNRILVGGREQPLRDLYYTGLLPRSEEDLKARSGVWKDVQELFADFAGTYNGGVFEPLEGDRRDVINQLPLSDWHVKRIIEKIADLPFRQELAKIIGYIYEKYIGKRLVIERCDPRHSERNRVRLEVAPERRSKGIYYTPQDVTRYIVGNTVQVLVDRLANRLDEVERLPAGEQPAALLALLEEAKGLTVCDPTCGSGAFLIEALAVLRDFYRRLGRAFDKARCPKSAPCHADFEKARRLLAAPGIFALNWNIYGVDLDPKAVEVAAVSLMIQVVDELRKDGERTVRFPTIMGENVKCGDSVISAIPLDRHEEILTGLAEEMAPVVALRRRLKEAATDEEKRDLRHRIESHLAPVRARVCTVDRGPRPFAYPLEFPEVFFGGAGGFAAVVGNPPYVDTRLSDYDGLGLVSIRAKNLYAYILENGIRYLRPGGRFGMITMLPLVCTLRMAGIQQYMLEQAEEIFVSTFDRRPNHLFRDANIRHAIVFGQKRLSRDASCRLYTTAYQRWYREEREDLLQRLRYAEATGLHIPGRLPKIGEAVESTLLAKVRTMGETIGDYEGRDNDPFIFYLEACCYWFKALSFIPFYQRGNAPETMPAHARLLRIQRDVPLEPLLAFLNSSLFFWYWLVYSDAFHVGHDFILETPFPYSLLTPAQKEELTRLAGELMEDLVRHKVRRETHHQQAGRIIYDEFYPRRSKSIIDRIDDVLAGVYGLTDEELAFVKTYQQRFRMDNDDGASEEEAGEEAETA